MSYTSFWESRSYKIARKDNLAWTAKTIILQQFGTETSKSRRMPLDPSQKLMIGGENSVHFNEEVSIDHLSHQKTTYLSTRM